MGGTIKNMLELPEALNIAKQLRSAVIGKTVSRVLPPTKAHKFCWYNGDPIDYDFTLSGLKTIAADGFGIYAEISFENDKKLCINDGVNVRLMQIDEIPKNYQLAICFDDASALVFTVAMYGGIVLHGSDYDNEYYLKSKSALSPFSDDFENYFYKLFSESKPTLSAKAFLATQQRFPGIGNGVLQDILFDARIHPKRKISTLGNEKEALFKSVRDVLGDMIRLGGRDTEKDLYGKSGGYITKMSKTSFTHGCAVCGGAITKEAYLGGSVYYCPVCQRIE